MPEKDRWEPLTWSLLVIGQPHPGRVTVGVTTSRNDIYTAAGPNDSLYLRFDLRCIFQMLSFLFWFPFCFGSQLPLISTEDSSSFIFNSLFGLLKQWPNTLHPNGHAIVPVTISPYTLLYHARTDTQNPPPSPEWVGFVPELGYGLAQMAPSGQPTYIHTYRSTRPLRTLVFDGLSAFPTEIDVGWMDSVATFIHGAGQRGTGKNRPAHGGLAEEYERAIKLCEWGNTRNIEGFIRMNSGL